MKIDYTLYLVTDRRAIKGKSLAEAVEEAILGGCTMVQLREKNITTREFYQLAKEIKQITGYYHIPFMINDRLDVALAVKANGIHIGQKDMPVKVVKEMIPQDMLLGVSVTNEEEALMAEKYGADYLGIGAVFPTKTKMDADFVPISKLCDIRKSVKIPIVAIGGITAENVSLLSKTQIDGIAVSSAILAKNDIKSAADELKTIITI